MYSLNAFGDMMLDRVRMEPYVQALRDAVRPDSVVLDIGTGTGIFAVLAHRFGARRVIAIEPDNAIQVARDIAAANGCEGAIEFQQVISTQLNLVEPADVIISDLRGVMPLFQQHIPSIIDARKRLLAPGGVMIPRRDELWVSLLEDPEAYAIVERPWSEPTFEVDLRPGRRVLANQWRRVAALASQLLAAPGHLGSLDYRTIESPNFSSSLRLVAARDGIAHGLCTWFDATLAEGIGFSNAPGQAGAPRPIYRNAFFPFLQPIELQSGDAIDVRMRADLVGDDYIWRWDARAARDVSENQTTAAYAQSSAAGEPVSLAQLKRRAAGYQPSLNDDGEIDRRILQLMAEGKALGDIATVLVSEYPARFADHWPRALARVGELSLRYSR